jgi:hypothetical protein
MNIPPSAYKLVTKIFDDPQDSMAMKVVADVCLHPSRVEGFGLNVIECQGLGTPVITTNFTAMGDFTKLGLSVSPEQYEYVANGVVATPDVNGIAQALDDIYEDLVENDLESRVIVTQDKIREAKDWVANHFAQKKVVSAFLYLLKISKKPNRFKHPQISFVSDPMEVPDAPWVIVYDHDNVKIDKLEANRIVKSQKSWKNLPELSLIPIQGIDQSDIYLERSTTPYAVLMRSYLFLQATTIFGSLRLRIGWVMALSKGKFGEFPSRNIARIRVFEENNEDDDDFDDYFDDDYDDFGDHLNEL